MTYEENREKVDAYRRLNRQIETLERKMSLHFNLYLLELQDEMKIEQLKYLIDTADLLKSVYKERLEIEKGENNGA